MGDTGEDFAEWVEPHLAELREYAARLVGPEDADRLAQDVLALAWRRRFNCQQDEPQEWLFALARERRERRVRRRRRRPAVPLAAVATAVAIAAGVVLLTDGQSSGPVAPIPPPTTAAAGLVAPSCGDGDLTVDRLQTDRTLGTTYLRIRLVSGRGAACQVRGFPVVVPLARGDRMDVRVVHRPDDALLRGLAGVVVGARDAAVVTLAWATDRACPAEINDRLVITLPGSVRPFAMPGFGRTACTDGATPSTLDVFPIRAAASSTVRLADCRHASFSAPPECV
jgi:hypothetical protein